MNESNVDQEPRESQTGEHFHILAEQAREQGRFDDALKHTDEASIRYQQEGNVIKFAEVQSSRFLILRHLFEQTGDRNFMILAKHSAEAAVEIMKASGQKEGLGIPVYNLGKAYETLGEYDEAVDTIRDAELAFDNAPQDPQGRGAVRHEMATRRAAIEYRLGNDEALERFDSALLELSSNPHPDSYTQSVWISGAHMHMADAMIARDRKNSARPHMDAAKRIIDSDERLKLRAGQLEKLAAKLT